MSDDILEIRKSAHDAAIRQIKENRAEINDLQFVVREQRKELAELRRLMK